MKYAVEPSLIPQIKSEYVQGKGSVREICEKFGVPFKPVEVRGSKEGWTQERESYLKRVCEKGLEKAQTRVEAYLEKISSRSENYQDLIDKSIATLVGSEGCIDPDAIRGYSTALKTLDDVARRAHGLVDPSLKVDLTSNGKSIGDSIIDAIARIRETPNQSPRLTDEEFAKVVDCEIIPD